VFNNNHQPSFSIINNHYPPQIHRKYSSSSESSESNNLILCSCKKETYSNRKRYRYYFKKTAHDNCQTKRIKTNSRSKNLKQRFNNSSVKFSIDLTGQNINYTIEYHRHSTIILPFCYDFYYISWLHAYYYYYYYLQFFDRECEEKTHGDLFFLFNLIQKRYLKFLFLSLAIQPPPTRSWLRLSSPNTTQPTAIFTIMNYNILCDKYATRHIYGHCPSWALKWDYRRKQILEELRSYSADIIALQVRFVIH
jgi:hypothetical protein